MTATTANFNRARILSALLVGTMLGGMAQPLFAQATDGSTAPAPAPAQGSGVIQSVNVSGSERLEPDTVRSYVKLVPGEPYNREALDQALKDLYETELFADVQVRDDGRGNITLQIRENPVVNRIVLEGNKRLKSDKINPEIKLAPRQIFTRSKVRADVNRIIELYRRQGRFAATVEPKMVQLDQNRVDIIFEIHEGDKSKVRKINIIGNEKFSDGRLRGEMATKQTGITKIFSSGTSYDPDRMSYDQQKLRQFYLTEGYADFRVVSAVAELTPDKKDFIITYVVEEGQRYKFGDVDLESDIRDIKAASFKHLLPMKKGDWYNAKQVEDTVDSITEATGIFGFTPDVRPDFNRDKDELTMGVLFKINQSPRVYVERIDINGNTHTKDKVVRREFRLSEGDAFNSFKVKRSRDRIQSLGFFQDKFEVEQKPGSAPDRVVLEANVEEKSTGELQVSAGYSSLERFIVDLSIRERNFMGKGQELRAGVSYSTYSKSIELGFTEPYVFDKNVAVGFDVFRRDYNSFGFTGNERNTTYEQTTTGFQIRAGVPLTEFITLAMRYGLSYDQVSLNKFTYYTNGVCDPTIAGRYLCDAIGDRVTSSVGYSLVFDNLNNRIRPSRGQRAVLSQDFAGLGGKVRYIKTAFEATKYWGLGGGFIFSAGLEGGYIKGLGQDVRLIDRFYLGEPEMRGFGIRGVGPRVIRRFFDSSTGAFATSNNLTNDDALGGDTYYKGRLELEIPLGNGARELGLRPSIFMDVGAVFGVKRPTLIAPENAGYPFAQDADGNYLPILRNQLDAKGRQIYIAAADTSNPGAATLCAVGYASSSKNPCVGGDPNNGNTPAQTSISPFREDFAGDTAKPRLSVGFGVNWNSPFGPFRIDIAKALLKEKGDNTKLFTFNVGTQF